MGIFNAHPEALHEFRRRTDRDAATTQAVMSYAYKCKKCGEEMRMPAGRKKYEFGGWICPGCAAK